MSGMGSDSEGAMSVTFLLGQPVLLNTSIPGNQKKLQSTFRIRCGLYSKCAPCFKLPSAPDTKQTDLLWLSPVLLETAHSPLDGRKIIGWKSVWLPWTCHWKAVWARSTGRFRLGDTESWLVPFLLRSAGNSLLQVILFILLSSCILIFSRQVSVCLGVSLPVQWHRLAQGRDGFVQGEGGQQEEQAPEGCRVLWAQTVLGEEYRGWSFRWSHQG